MTRLIDRASTNPGNCSRTGAACVHASAYISARVASILLRLQRISHASIYTPVDLKARVCVFTAGKHQDRWHTVKYGVETGVAIKARSHPLASLSPSSSWFGIYVRMNTRTKPVRMTGYRYLQSMQKGENAREALKRIILLSLISESWQVGERSCALHASNAFCLNRAHINELELIMRYNEWPVALR